METVTISREEYEAQTARLTAQEERIAELEQQISLLMEALRLARHKRFGASSEKVSGENLEQLSFLFNEAEVCAGDESAEEAGEPSAPAGSTGSTSTRWRISQRVPLLRSWSTVWRARIWCARNAAIP